MFLSYGLCQLSLILMMMLLVIECLLPQMVLSYNFPSNSIEAAYPHFYTGAFMSPGYPTRRSDNNYGVLYDMFFGGLPPNTYTTIRLHSAPSLLSGGTLQMASGSLGGRSYLAFSSDLYTPISVFTAENHIININVNRDFTSDLHPAFLFSYEGKY